MTLVRFQHAPSKNLLSDFWNQPFDNAVAVQPVVNILETADGFRIEVAAPGLNKEDFKISVEKNLLTISAQKENARAEEGVKVHRREFAYGAFERVFRLPETIDTNQIKANFKNGILYVNLDKKAETKPAVKTIEIG
ncbi:MAG: Hsp20/alpha crystallin family protein [Thermoanaerobaculia bacterium]|nr:Hsp20/alpha crystallin family protein [Thermoanaerobaculia bacterium]